MDEQGTDRCGDRMREKDRSDERWLRSACPKMFVSTNSVADHEVIIFGPVLSREDGVSVGPAVEEGAVPIFDREWCAYPPAVARRFTPELAALVGYHQHRPNLGNCEGQCPSMLLGDDIDAAIGAVDALRPDQTEMVAAYVAGQRPGG